MSARQPTPAETEKAPEEWFQRRMRGVRVLGKLHDKWCSCGAKDGIRNPEHAMDMVDASIDLQEIWEPK